MTRDEFKMIVKGMKSVYSFENFIKDQDAFNMWYELLSDQEYQQVAVATKKLMQTSNRVPTPADIRALATEKADMRLSEGEVVALVRKAIRNSSYHAQEEYDKLPETIQRAVGNPARLRDWAQTDNLNHEVLDSEIVNSYRRVLSQHKVDSAMSPDVRAMISNLLGGSDERKAIQTDEK